MQLNRRKRIMVLAIAVALILLVPLVAMLFTDEVNWSVFDFLVAGALLFGTGLIYELVARNSCNITYRVAVGVAAVAGLLLIWLNLAVGLIGSENNPANLMYLGVLQVGVIGAAIARLQPRGMARALYATALAQAVVPVIALIFWQASVKETPGPVGVFILNGFFVTLFVVSGSLFRHSDTTAQGTGK